MNIRNIIIVLAILLIVAVAFFAAGGPASLSPKPTPTPDLAAMSELENLVTASGTLVPATRANLSFKMAGPVSHMAVKAGEVVTRGTTLVQLDSEELAAAVSQAQYSLNIATANLNELRAGATKAEIAVAQANLDTALAQLAKVQAGPTIEEVAIAKAGLDRAQSAVRDAQSAYDKIKDDPSAGMYPQSQALESAHQQYKVAEASYNKTVKGAAPEDIRVAEANVAAARAGLERVQSGTRPEEIAAAQARVDAAQSAVRQARAALAAATLTAPFDGTVAALNIKEGEMVTPGVPVITLGDLSNLRLETDDLSETNIARVRLGQPVSVTFEALPGQTFSGKVTNIALISTQKQGGTNYQVTIEFDHLDSNLRWGMTGHIEINAK